MAWVKTNYGYMDDADPGHQLYDYGGGKFYDPLTGQLLTEADLGLQGNYQPAATMYTPQWYEQINAPGHGAGSYDAEKTRFAQLDATNALGEYESIYGEYPEANPDAWFANAWKGGGELAEAQDQAATAGDFIESGGLAKAMIAAFAGGAGLEALGGLGGAAGGAETFGSWMPGMTGGADFAGLSAAESGLGSLGGGSMGWEDFLQLASDGGEELAWDPTGADAEYLQNWLTQGAAEGGTSFSGGLLSNLTKLLGGTGTGSSNDLLSALGRAAPGLIGAFASNQQTDAITGLANKYAEMGAPYRQRLSDLYSNPSSFLSSPEVQVPVQQGTDALARSLSAKVGNPIGNMTAMSDIQNYASNQLFGRLGQEKDRLAGFGGLSNYNQAAPGLEQSAIASNANFWNALGSSASNVFNPQTDAMTKLAQILGSGNIFKVT